MPPAPAGFHSFIHSIIIHSIVIEPSLGLAPWLALGVRVVKDADVASARLELTPCVGR